jgi:hypothetical protein
MGFLLKRNIPKALAGWSDNFARPDESPIRQPWGSWRATSPSALVGGVLQIPAFNGSTIDASKGVGYEFQPLTENWGFEFDLNLNATGVFNQNFMVFLTRSWPKNFENSIQGFLGLDLWWEAPAPIATRTLLRFDTYTNSYVPTVLAETNQGSGSFWNGAWHTYKVHVTRDMYFRLYIDGAQYVATNIPAAYRTSLNNRGTNFGSAFRVAVSLDSYHIYDDYTTSPFDLGTAWVGSFFDNFERPNGAVLNGWTTIGAAGQIVSGTYNNTGTTDGGRAILRDSGFTGGRQRVEGVINANANTGTGNNDDRLFLCSNSAGTQGLCARIWRNTIRICRYSSALSGNPPTFTAFNPDSQYNRGVLAGDVVGFNVNNGVAWVDVNGEPVASTSGPIHTVVPASNSWMGLGLSRSVFSNSVGWQQAYVRSWT